MQSIHRALNHLLRAMGDPISDLADIGPGQPEHLHAEVIRAAVGVLAKVPDTLPVIWHATREVDTPGVPARLRAHLRAAQSWARGDAMLAANQYAEMVNHWPRDLLAMRLAQSCYFFLGRADRMCALADEAMKAWQRSAPGYGFMLAMASFAHAESGHAERAEQLGREALRRDPACPMGVHAVAHAIAEAGRPGAGAAWMRARRAHWSVPSRMRTHNAWHLAVFDVDDGHPAPALSILDSCLLPAAGTSPVDACDATSLLWRLAGNGLEIGDRWHLLSNAFENRWQPGFWPYVDLHAALAHLRAGQRPRFDRLQRSVEQCAADDNPTSIRAREITVPLLRAIDLRSGDEAAATAVSGLQAAINATGGSRIQLEILTTRKDEVVRRASSRADYRRLPGEKHVDHHRQAH